MTFEEFLVWEASTHDTLDVKKIYIDLAGDLVAGILLSQIVYWHLPSRNGGLRLRVQHDGKYWLAKTRYDWWDECRISPRQFDRAIEILSSKGVVESHVYKFDGNPTKHLRLVSDQFMLLLEEVLNKEVENPFSPKGEIGYSPKGNNDIPQTGISLTETTSENTYIKTTRTENSVHAGPRGVGFKPPENEQIIVPGNDLPIDPPTPQQAYILHTIRAKTLTDAMNQSLNRKIYYTNRSGKETSNTINNLLESDPAYKKWIESVIVLRAKTVFQPPKKISRQWFINAIANLQAFEDWAAKQHIPEQTDWEPLED